MKEIDNKTVILINDIKKDIISTRNNVLSDANNELINLYFRIGLSISENYKYDKNFINILSVSLKNEFSDINGFSPRNLIRMKKFYETYKDLTALPDVVKKLTWSHNCLLIEKISDKKERNWYAEKAIDNSWSIVVLNHQIELKLF